MFKHRLLICLAGLFSLFQLAAQTNNAFYSEEMVVTASALNLRDAPNTNGKKLITMPRGSVVQFVEAHNNGEGEEVDSLWGSWYKVRYQSKTGYVFSPFVTSAVGLYYEGDFMDNLPPLQWYGVFARDSFSDELRRVNVKLVDEENEMYGGRVKVLRTNQKEPSKFLIGTLSPMKTGYCGPLGVFDLNLLYFSKSLQPGSQLSIYPGNEETDTLIKPTYGLIATGCASLQNAFVQVKDYALILIDYAQDPVVTQDMTPWVKTELPETNPSVDLLWFGDLDHDNKPDAIIQDCPYEMGCRASLFLSSKAKPGEYLRKVCEHFWPGD